MKFTLNFHWSRAVCCYYTTHAQRRIQHRTYLSKMFLRICIKWNSFLCIKNGRSAAINTVDSCNTKLQYKFRNRNMTCVKTLNLHRFLAQL